MHFGLAFQERLQEESVLNKNRQTEQGTTLDSLLCFQQDLQAKIDFAVQSELSSM